MGLESGFDRRLTGLESSIQELLNTFNPRHPSRTTHLYARATPQGQATATNGSSLGQNRRMESASNGIMNERKRHNRRKEYAKGEEELSTTQETDVRRERRYTRRRRRHHHSSGFSDSSASTAQEYRQHHDVIPRHRGLDLERHRSAPMLKDRSNPVAWLINYGKYTSHEEWPPRVAAKNLVKIWDDGSDISLVDWVLSLPKQTQTNLLRMERDFLWKCGKEHMSAFKVDIWTGKQPERETCTAWFASLQKNRQMLARWEPHGNLTDEQLILSLDRRFTNKNMQLLLSSYFMSEDPIRDSRFEYCTNRGVVSASRPTN